LKNIFPLIVLKLSVIFLVFSNHADAEECPPGYDCMTVNPDPSIGMGGGGGGIVYPEAGGYGGGTSGGVGTGSGNGSNGSEYQRAKAYSECIKKAESKKSSCISARSKSVGLAADLCFATVSSGSAVASVYASPLTGLAIAVLGNAGCIGAKHADLELVDRLCSNIANNEKAACG